MGTFVFAPQLISLFHNDPDVVAFGVVTLRVQSLTMPLTGGAMVTNFMPQTAGKMWRATFLGACRLGLVLGAVVLALPPLFGVLGVQPSQPVTDIVTTEPYRRIRNYKLRLVPPGELIQREVEKYDQRTVLEALHNRIAHQDYSQHSRVAVMGYPDRLVFVSQGSFFEGTPDEYALEGHMPKHYRNTTLVTAMTALNMIDHLGYGIERMNHSQAKRYLPLPEYDLSDPSEVKLTIWGSVVDEAYTSLLMSRPDLPFDEVMALDRVQKGRPVSDEVLRRLRKKKLVEGRRPRLRVSASVAEATGTKVDYLVQRGQSMEYLCAVVTDLLAKSGPCSRTEIDDALRPHLSANLDASQRRNKVDHLLRSMRREAKISSVRIEGKRVWVLA